jgi:hypothetical protein
MSTYTPDCWELLKITSPEHGVIYKVIAGWYGGFAGSNSWKISSGIENVVEHEDRFEMPQSSGSVYVCYKSSRRMSGLMMDIYVSFKKKLSESGAATMELLTETSPTELEI